MYLETATRKQAKIKLSMAGSSGSGKTYSALLLAHGICNNWRKIAIIDTENYSASLYSHLGNYNVVNIVEPFSPLIYIEAIKLCEDAGMEVIIIDSITHEWQGKGGCLDLHEKETARMRIPNSFTAWSKITPLHQEFINTILQSKCHIISTIRSKTEYVLTERNGKQVPQKVGMSPITRDGFEFEVTIAFDIDQNHKAFATKDRSGLFQDKEPIIITEEIGRKIIEWCNNAPEVSVDDVSRRIGDCRTIDELLNLYKQHPAFAASLKPEFEQQKRRILINSEVSKTLSTQKTNPNGTTTY